MKLMFFKRVRSWLLISILVFFVFNLMLPVPALVEKIDGLQYEIRKIESPALQKQITKYHDLYELYFENMSPLSKTFSIPGYSIDLGVDYTSLSEIESLYKDSSSKKSSILNIAAGAASIAFGGIARTAASTVKSVGSLRKRNLGLALSSENNFLSSFRTYVIYPGDGLSLFFFINKTIEHGQVPNSIRFICHDEDANINYVVINNKLQLKTESDPGLPSKEIPSSNENLMDTLQEEQ